MHNLNYLISSCHPYCWNQFNYKIHNFIFLGYNLHPCIFLVFGWFYTVLHQCFVFFEQVQCNPVRIPQSMSEYVTLNVLFKRWDQHFHSWTFKLYNVQRWTIWTLVYFYVALLRLPMHSFASKGCHSQHIERGRHV